MWLVVRDVELTDAEGEVDRVEIFERRREVRQVQREKHEGESNDERRGRKDRKGRFFFALVAVFAFLVERHAGRRNSPSLRLPVR